MSSKTDDLFKRRVARVLPNEQSLNQLIGKRKIRVYQGFDPTAPRLHLGHTIGMKKLMDFARAGHEVIFLFGTGTVMAGDPSLRDTPREPITEKHVDENIKNWQRQASLVVDFDKVKIKKNHEWLSKMTLNDIIALGSHISAVQLFKRESFTRRLKAGNTVWFSETMYPLLQGYDSVVMDVDLEIGGTDQEFNMLMGRELQAKISKREKFVLVTPMIMGTDGQPMSKSTGNCIWLDDSPDEKFAKLMAINDGLIIDYLTHLTDMSLSSIGDYAKRLIKGDNPRDIKKVMAHQIVNELHGANASRDAQNNWVNQFSEGKMPDDIPNVEHELGSVDSAKLVFTLGLASSMSDARRLMQQGGIKLNGKTVTASTIIIGSGDVLQAGKRRFAKITKGKN